MRPSALTWLRCPRCDGRLVVMSDQTDDDGHVMAGSLSCTSTHSYSIIDGVPWLLTEDSDIAEDSKETADRFGTEWHLFDGRADYYEQQFLDWIAPVTAADFADKVVLEGGCGKGRHTRLVAGYGAKAIISLDLGSAVDVAFAATRHLPNAHVIRADIMKPPVARAIDLAFSIGVLHHLPDPRGGFAALVDRVVDGGRVSAWVYGLESNEWIVKYVDPVRKNVTSRIPERALYLASLAPSALVSGALKAYRRERIAKRLPYGDYLHYISGFPFKEVHHIVFDQLVTPIAHYLPEGEVRSWFERDDVRDVEVAWHNRNSWRATARIFRGG